jgi:hypothetical protein
MTDVTLVRLPLTPAGERAIRLDGGTQARTVLHQPTVDEYAEAIRHGAAMPPVVVFDDGTDLWLADGFHRYHAHLAAEATGIDCDVYEGSQRDAILYSLKANAHHGLRRSNEDKKKAVMTLLNDAEWSAWSSRDIGKACGVSHDFVARLKSSLSSDDSDKPVTYTTKHGTTATMSTANIGKTNAADWGEQLPMPEQRPPAAADWPFESAEDKAAAADAAAAPSAEVEALRAELADMADALQQATDDNELMRKVFEADDHLAEAMARLKQAEGLARVLQTRVDGLMNEKNEVIRRYKAAKRDLEKLQKDMANAA